MAKAKEIDQELMRSRSPETLPFRYQKGMYVILTTMYDLQTSGGIITPKSLKKELPDGKLDKSRFFRPAIDWLVAQNMVIETSQSPKGLRRSMKLTEKGQLYYAIWNDLMSTALEDVELSLNIARGRTISLKLRSEGWDDLDTRRVLLEPTVRENMVALLYSIITRFHISSFDLTISGQDLPSNSELYQLAAYMELAYIDIINNRSPPNELYDDHGIDVVRSWSKEELYSQIWRHHTKKAVKSFEAGESVTTEYVRSLLPPELIELVKKSQRIRHWIDKKLNRDPDFFIPHIFWIALGFKQRKIPDVPTRINPPPPEIWLSYDEFSQKLIETEDMLRHAHGILSGKIQPLNNAFSKEQAAYDFIHGIFAKYDWDLDPDFYRCWMVLRRNYSSSLPDVSSILDAAFAQYRSKSLSRPDVDLAKVFADLARKKHGAHEAIEMIRKGDHGIGSKKKPRYYPLERKK
jgi:hypothetical protein